MRLPKNYEPMSGDIDFTPKGIWEVSPVLAIVVFGVPAYFAWRLFSKKK